MLSEAFWAGKGLGKGDPSQEACRVEKLGWFLERGRGKVRDGRQIQAEQLQTTEAGVVLQTGTERAAPWRDAA